MASNIINSIKNQQSNRSGVVVQPGDQQSTTRQPESQQPAEDLRPKETFKDPFAIHAESMVKRKGSADDLVKKAMETKTSDMVDKANQALSNGSSIQKDMREFDEFEKISDEDLALAEQIVFKGYAEYNVVIPNMPSHVFTLCTSSAEDMSIIDEILYDMVKQREDKTGDVDLPAQHVETMKAALFLALGFKGADGKDFCDEPINQMMTIKRAIIKIKELEYAGEMEKAKSLNDSLKKSLKYRAVRMRRYPTPVIDFLSHKKYEFDTKMYTIMMSDKIIPKSSGQSRDMQDRYLSSQGSSSNSDQ